MPDLQPNSVVDAVSLQLHPEAIHPSDILSGEPVSALYELIDTPMHSVGVWELSPGVVTDTEREEVFVVLAGSASVEFDGTGSPLILRPGSVGRLAAGTRTRWTVTETLRKIYLMAPEASKESTL